jgi:hypothetical protein
MKFRSLALALPIAIVSADRFNEIKVRLGMIIGSMIPYCSIQF